MKKKKILLVEDEPTIQRLLHFVLSKEFELHTADNGYDAFLWLENGNLPDLIIMDWVMPQMDGKTFLKCLKVSGVFSEIPIIILSASSGIPEQLDNSGYSVEHYLHKPFDPVVLKDAIENIFNAKTYGFLF